MQRLLRVFLLSCLTTIGVDSFAQSVDLIGAETTLDLATWNIEWFGNGSNGPTNEDLQLENVRKIIAETGVDLWAIQEIANSNQFDDLIAALGEDFEGTLATNSVEQKIGFIYNKHVIRVSQVQHILENFARAFAFRPPLKIKAEVTLPNASLDVTFIVLHMKAFSDSESYGRRVEASMRLKSHIDFTSLDKEPVVILGDFNDELERSTFAGRASPYENFAEDTDNFSLLTLPLEQNGSGSFCENATCSRTGNMLDHIIVTNELNTAYIQGSAGFIPNLTSEVVSFGSTTSDHLPVVARFDIEQTVLSDELNETLPAKILIQPPYPNPFSRQATISVTAVQPLRVTIEAYDILGRRVDILADDALLQGRHSFTFSPEDKSAGTYFIRVTMPDGIMTYILHYIR